MEDPILIECEDLEAAIHAICAECGSFFPSVDSALAHTYIHKDVRGLVQV